MAIGRTALYFNTSGSNNTAAGYRCMWYTTSSDNTGYGSESMNSNTTGTYNSAFGVRALSSNTTTNYNTAIGYEALSDATTGYSNTAVGYRALDEITTGYNLTSIGFNSGPISAFSSVSNSTAVGYNAQNNASNQVRLGNSSVTSIGGFEPWTDLSDERYKENIKDSELGLDFILKLRPVTYNLNVEALNSDLGVEVQENDKDAIDAKSNILKTGFIAQEVEKAALSLGQEFNGVDTPKNENDFYGLRYSVFVVPLVKAVQEQQIIIEHQKDEIEKMKQQLAEFDAFKARIETVESLLKK